jgi:hypothetical protein
LIWFGVGMGGVLFECGTEHLSSIKCEEFLYKLRTAFQEDCSVELVGWLVGWLVSELVSWLVG